MLLDFALYPDQRLHILAEPVSPASPEATFMMSRKDVITDSVQVSLSHIQFSGGFRALGLEIQGTNLEDSILQCQDMVQDLDSCSSKGQLGSCHHRVCWSWGATKILCITKTKKSTWEGGEGVGGAYIRSKAPSGGMKAMVRSFSNLANRTH